MIHITHHALTRAMERVPGIDSEAKAFTLLSAEVIQNAAAWGARYVRLGTGQRIVIDIDRAVTVLPKDYWIAAMDPRRTAQFETRY
ncbi:hypothetical protein WBP06_09385 [Novosphingobium sp. BL-8H]|uniref:hypothetical protein n=1 Tax=Novosphingobium sp. BL-8H TaxID=3127640 RepID=UPI003757C75A